MSDQMTQLRTKVRTDLDLYMDQLDKQTEEFLAGERTIQHVTSYIDTWQHTRGKVQRYSWKLGRHLADQRDVYDDKVRRSKTGGLRGESGGLHYEERLAKYETLHLEDYKSLRTLEKLVEEVKSVGWAFQHKISWLEDMRRQMRREEDDFRFASVKDHIGS